VDAKRSTKRTDAGRDDDTAGDLARAETLNTAEAASAATAATAAIDGSMDPASTLSYDAPSATQRVTAPRPKPPPGVGGSAYIGGGWGDDAAGATSAAGVGAAGADSQLGRTLRAAGSGAASTGRVIGGAGQAVYGRIQKWTHAQGAGESGLAQVIELHAVSTAGDLMVTLALANSLFFSVQPGAARGKVALYLLITMVPFVLLAPVIGPLLDRLRGGRRYAMATTLLARAVLALVLAKTLGSGGFAAYPAAFGCLVASKAYGVSRSAAMPRVLPPGITLVKANSRATMASVIVTVVAGPIGAGLTKLGPSWGLVFAAVVFLLATVMAIRLPRVVDSNEGEEKAQLTKRDRNMDPRLAETMPDLRLRSVGPRVMLALRANAVLRGFSGFLTIFLAFLTAVHPLNGLKPLVIVGLAATAAVIGNAIGTALAGLVKERAPEAVICAMIVLMTSVAIVSALFYGLPTLLAVAATIAFTQAMAKLALDALMQRETLERVRVSAFARSETVLQLAYVIGGLLGIAMPTNGTLGFALGAVALSAGTLITVKSLADARQRQLPRVGTT
jgi:hypothetical protein